MSNNFCPSCGHPISEGANFCLNCGHRIANNYDANSSSEDETQVFDGANTNLETGTDQSTTTVIDQPSTPNQPEYGTPGSPGNQQMYPPQPFPPLPYSQPYPQQRKKSNVLIYILTVFIVTLCMVGGFFGYKIYSDKNTSDTEQEEAQDATAETVDIEASNVIPTPNTTIAYTACRLNLRSTPDHTVCYNYLTTLDFGTEVNILANQGVWSKVQISSGPYRGYSGWVAAHYILNPVHFEILKSILPDNLTRNVIKESYFRYALLQYFLEHKYIGNIPAQTLESLGMSDFKVTDNNQWEVTRPYEVKTQRLINAGNRYSDLAVVIRNLRTGAEKLLYFTIDNNENGTLYREMPLTSKGTIVSIGLEANGDIKPYVTG